MCVTRFSGTSASSLLPEQKHHVPSVPPNLEAESESAHHPVSADNLLAISDLLNDVSRE
ncbi:MAG: hypothetical protein MI923_03625 [Phycisphaerales bacterium]|nr:hypothetical protein [Phycisphaerales bacterium]